MLQLKERMATRTLTKIAVLSVISFLIMYILEIPLWFTPAFLKMDLSDIPALIGAFALGPMAGVAIEFVKIILHLAIKGTTTMGVGSLANFLVGAIFVYTAGYVYAKNKTIKGAVIGMIAGTLVVSAFAAVLNYTFLIPFYAKLYGVDVGYFVELGSAVNKYVSDYRTFILFGIIPFNLFKYVVVSIITIPLYKRISHVIKN